MQPTELSMAFLEARNRRDADAIRSLLDPDVDYARPGPRAVEGVDAIMAQYDEDWRTYDATIEVRPLPLVLAARPSAAGASHVLCRGFQGRLDEGS